jgi:HK97 family phage prohead protease
MSDLITRRFVPDLAVRADGTGRTISGIVVPYDTPARVSDGGPAYMEKFQRGAFAQTINHGVERIKLLQQHDHDLYPLGRAVNLREDAAGLYGEFIVSDTQAGRDVLALVRDGALDSFSVGFRPINHTQDGEVTVRTEVALREVSVVTFPAYADAAITGLRATPGQEAAHGTTDEVGATPDDDALRQSRRLTWNNFRASLIEKGII